MDTYYIIQNNSQQGPYTLEELKEKRINAQTMVWKEGLPQWIPAGQVPELRALLSETPPAGPTGIPPKTWLAESILATIFCCLPLGIVGIVYATKVETAYYAGRYYEARRYSNQAKLWTLWAAGISLAGIILYCLALLVFGLSGLLGA